MIDSSMPLGLRTTNEGFCEAGNEELAERTGWEKGRCEREFQKGLSLLKWDNGASVKYKIKTGMKASWVTSGNNEHWV